MQKNGTPIPMPTQMTSIRINKANNQSGFIAIICIKEFFHFFPLTNKLIESGICTSHAMHIETAIEFQRINTDGLSFPRKFVLIDSQKNQPTLTRLRPDFLL